jgi:spermidine synthase
VRKAFYFYFFFSGLAGLIYEVLWVRLFVVVMGGTVYSFTTVLVAFMGGLTIGGWVGGKYADRAKQSPLLVYGILEGAIGFYCLLIPLLITGLNPVFNWLYPFISSHNFAGLLIRFFFSGIILAAPTTMMGATLPILVRYSYNQPEEFGKTAGRLYSINTFGAVAGSFVSGIILIPTFGQRNTLYLTAGINLLIFFSILVLSRLRQPEFAPAREQFKAAEKEVRLSLRAGLALAFYAISGAAAMIYQLAWTRALILSLGTTLYVLSMILTAYIAGLAVGAGVITPLVDRIKKLWLWAGIFELLIGTSAWAVVPLFARLPLWVALAHRPATYMGWLGMEFLAGSALIFVPTFVMGALLPVVVRLYAQLRGGVGSAVGEVYAWNTIGAILGSFLCGFFLINWLGLRNSLILASVMSLAIGAAFVLSEKGVLAIKLAAPIAVVLIIAAFLRFIPGWDPAIINSGPYVYYDIYAPKNADAATLEKELKSGTNVLYYKEGVEATVSVLKFTAEKTIGLRINGKTDASTGTDMSTQLLLGHLPLLLKPDAGKAAIIGLASGVTLGAVLDYPVKEAVCAEISPDVVAASKYFTSVNQRPLEDPRTRLIVNDGRHHLAHTSDIYDVIVSEPSNPWMGGMGMLFTREFFELARKRLAPGGVFLVWVGIYDLDADSVRIIFRTFINVFPQATLWESVIGGDYLLLGFNGPVKIDYSAIKTQFANPKVQTDMARAGINRPENILGRFLMGPGELEEFADGGPLHTDDYRQLEFNVPRAGYLKSYSEKVLPTLAAFDKYRTSPDRYIEFSNPDDKSDLENIDKYYHGRQLFMNSFVQLQKNPNNQDAVTHMAEGYQADPGDQAEQEALYNYYSEQASQFIGQERFEEAVLSFQEAWKYRPQGSAIPTLLSFYYMQRRDLKTAEEWDNRAIAENQSDPLPWLVRGRIELAENRPDLALNSLTRAMNQFPANDDLLQSSDIYRLIEKVSVVSPRAQIYFSLGNALQRLGKVQQALQAYLQAETVKPDYIDAFIASGKIFMDLGQIDSGIDKFRRAAQIAPNIPFTHLFYAQALAKAPGRQQDAIGQFKEVLRLAPQDWPRRKEAEKGLSDLLNGR